jgi:hypothetical protein
MYRGKLEFGVSRAGSLADSNAFLYSSGSTSPGVHLG